jgi:protein arginine N-methyltransferase 1
VLQVSFQYRAGGAIPSLQASLRAEVLYEAALQSNQMMPAFA